LTIKPRSQKRLLQAVSLSIDCHPYSPRVAACVKRLQSDVEVGAALSALVERVDLIETGMRVALKLPHSIPHWPPAMRTPSRLSESTKLFTKVVSPMPASPETNTTRRSPLSTLAYAQLFEFARATDDQR
jgi:hypothetical protein